MPQGACRGYGTIRPATPTDCRYAESIHRICHRPAASRASKTHFSGLGPPWRSHPCIEGYPQCHRVRAVGMERSDRQHQPIADTQSRFTVYVTGLLPAEPPKRIFRVWGRHGARVLLYGAVRAIWAQPRSEEKPRCWYGQAWVPRLTLTAAAWPSLPHGGRVYR